MRPVLDSNLEEFHPIARAEMIDILTGEYPPTTGGVSDYTALIARKLAAQGQRVNVWAPGQCAVAIEHGVHVYRSTGRFSTLDLALLDQELNEIRDPRRLLVQWTPHSFGMRSLNVPLAAWLWKRATRNHDRIELMIHEPFVAFGEGTWRQDAAALVHRLMAAMLMRAASKVWISIPAWENALRPWCGRNVPEFEWLPVPSNIGAVLEHRAVFDLRTRLVNGDQHLIGHFGTFRNDVGSLLRPALIHILESSDCSFLLVGKGSEEFARSVIASRPLFAARIFWTGEMPPDDIARHLSACDVLLQPYPDGISTRRSTAMASLALGMPVITNTGHLSESFWASSGAVRIASSSSAGDLTLATLSLSRDESAKAEMSASARRLYNGRFDICHTIAKLQSGHTTGTLRGTRAPV